MHAGPCESDRTHAQQRLQIPAARGAAGQQQGDCTKARDRRQDDQDVRGLAPGVNTLTGPVTDQADIFPDLANPAYEDNADEAIHRFIA